MEQEDTAMSDSLEFDSADGDMVFRVTDHDVGIARAKKIAGVG
jgi:hypothetical protein